MDILKAYQLLHTGQAGHPYIEHLSRVLLRVQVAGSDPSQQITALLYHKYGEATRFMTE